MFNMNPEKNFPCFWVVQLPYNTDVEETRVERRERRQRDGDILKAAGFDVRTEFAFRYLDPKEKKDALKAQAQELADKIEAATGVKMAVTETTPL